MSKNLKGVVRVRRRSIIKLQILIELLIITNINIANIGIVGVTRIKISRIVRINKGDK